MRPIELTGPIGATIMILVIGAVLGLTYLAWRLARTSGDRRGPKWALAAVTASYVANGAGNLLATLWLRALAMLLDIVALVLVANELWYRRRRAVRCSSRRPPPPSLRS